MRWGLASSEMEVWPSMRVARMARRVGSARAPKVESRDAEYLTIWFSIAASRTIVNGKIRKMQLQSASEGGSYNGKKLVGRLENRVTDEKFGEMACQMGFCFDQGDRALEEFFEGGGFAIGDAAGNDEVEVTKVGGNVVGETVGGDPAADVHTNGGEFFFAGSSLNPDTGFSRDTIGGDAEIAGGANHGLFQRS